MFTGIIRHLGKAEEQSADHFLISCQTLLGSLNRGESIALNGVCLTITKVQGSAFAVDVMPETRRKTALSDLKIADLVNLELPVTLQDYLSGHLIYGHVDGIGTIDLIKAEGSSQVFSVSTSSELTDYMVTKGAVALNGISLTLISVKKGQFTVGIIPYTLRHTMFKKAKIGDKLNIETDIIGKYVRRFII